VITASRQGHLLQGRFFVYLNCTAAFYGIVFVYVLLTSGRVLYSLLSLSNTFELSLLITNLRTKVVIVHALFVEDGVFLSFSGFNQSVKDTLLERGVIHVQVVYHFGCLGREGR